MLTTTFSVAVMIDRQLHYANTTFSVADMKTRQSSYVKSYSMG